MRRSALGPLATYWRHLKEWWDEHGTPLRAGFCSGAQEQARYCRTTVTASGAKCTLADGKTDLAQVNLLSKTRAAGVIERSLAIIDESRELLTAASEDMPAAVRKRLIPASSSPRRRARHGAGGVRAKGSSLLSLCRERHRE